MSHAPPAPKAPRAGTWARRVLLGFHLVMALWFMARLLEAVGAYLSAGSEQVPDGPQCTADPALLPLLLAWLAGGVALAGLAAAARRR